jgi:sugar/nucleoside kinase (ribokinase family)
MNESHAVTFDVVGFGESSVDYVYVVSTVPSREESKVPISSHFSACGGQVATTMAACAALGLKAAYLGPVGNDPNGARVKTELESRGVDVSRLIVRAAVTRYAVILVEESTGERKVLWRRDERLRLADDDVTHALIAGARVLHVDAVDEPASVRAATLGR